MSLKKYQSREEWFSMYSRLVLFETKNFSDASVLNEHFILIGAKIISMSPQNTDPITFTGNVLFGNFKAAFEALCSRTDEISYRHLWYTDWSSCQPDKVKVEDSFLDSMLDSLNDDCTFEVLKYLNPLQLHYMSKHNRRMAEFINNNMTSFASRMKITKDSVGIIGIMNFHYLLLEYGSKFNELLVSITAFRSSFGSYSTDMKYNILFLIMELAKNLKKLHLIGFNLDSEDNTVGGTWFQDAYGTYIITLIDAMKAKGVQIVYG